MQRNISIPGKRYKGWASEAGSADKGMCCQTWGPEFKPQDPHGGRRELILAYCPHLHMQKSPQYAQINRNFKNGIENLKDLKG